MLYIIGILVAFLLVCGQALWKVGVQHAHLELTAGYLFSKQVFSLIFSPYIIGGAVIYAFATLMYLGLLAKYQYSTVQGLVVPVSLISAFLLARVVFNERLSVVNYVGLGVLVVGILLATRR
ncbi:hypothetical protein HJC99_03795 [Candidatus Saccharibacteria bacterium]|nr:hypothetical protein [Candidatus Saccharibacteria bacterium]